MKAKGLRKKSANAKRMVPLEDARWQLGSIWFGGSALLFMVLAVQSLTGVYEGRVQGVWGWALPNIFPTLSLMLAAFKATALGDDTDIDDIRVRRPFLLLAVGLSIFHLLCVLVTLISHVFVPALMADDETKDPMKLFEISNLWLGPIQGFVAATLGTLFFTKTAGGPTSASPVSSSKADESAEPTHPSSKSA